VHGWFVHGLARVVLVVVGATLDVVVVVVVDVDVDVDDVVDVVVWADAALGTSAMTTKRMTRNDLLGRLMFPPSFGVFGVTVPLASPCRAYSPVARAPSMTGRPDGSAGAVSGDHRSLEAPKNPSIPVSGSFVRMDPPR
jgi:hypothetical protein